MNTKIRALLWEELRVGGAIAGTCSLVGLVGQLAMAFGAIGRPGEYGWHHVASAALTFTLGVPLMTALLLILNTANSGHLESGFSRRILRLPVDTWSTVLVVLLTRLIEVLAVSAFMTALCWALFLHGPGTRAVFLVAGIYLFVQVLDWARAVAALLVPVAFLAALGALLEYVGGMETWGRVLASSDGVTPAFLLSFALSVALAYAVSMVLVRQTRRGKRLSLLSVGSFDAVMCIPALERRKPFASPLGAQIWFELRRAGWFFPAMVLVFWLVGNGARWLVMRSYVMKPGDAHDFRLLDPLWTFEILPFVALLLAAFAWTLRTGSRPGKGRPAVFPLRQPITKAQMAQARLVAAAVNLGLALAVIAAVSATSFLLADDGQIRRLIAEALAHGEIGLREVAGILLGPPLLAGLLAWVIMGLSKGLRWPPGMAELIGMCAAILVVAVLLDVGWAGQRSRALAQALILLMLWLAMLSPTLLLGEGLLTTWRRRLMSKRSFLVCAVLWTLFTVAFFPFSATHDQARPTVLFLVSLALGALVVLPYVNATIELSRRGPREPAPAENPDQHRRVARRAYNGRAGVMAIAALVALLVALAWIRWPQEPRWKTAWRGQGLPTDLEELKAWFAPVEPEQNLANRYLAAAEKCTQLEQRWAQSVLLSDEISADNGANRAYVLEDVWDHLVIVGSADAIKRGEPIPPDLWRWMKRYWNEVASKVCLDLHAVAHSGLTQSRYPIDLRLGAYAQLPHLAKRRGLARQLAVEAWVASVERRPTAAVDAILDMFPIGASLKDDPTVISQLVHIAIYGMALGSLEDALNRVVFAESDLERLERKLARVLPPANQKSLLEPGMIGEQVTLLAGTGIHRLWSPELVERDPSLVQVTAANALTPVSDLLGYKTFERLVTIRLFAQGRERSQQVAQHQRAPDLEHWKEFWTPRIRVRAFWASLVMPALSHIYESEWRIRTQLDMARTALAVERYRLAHGRLPGQLDKLVPAFLDDVPRDPWNEWRPLSYRIKDNNEFVVYSYGRDREDDHGEEDPKRNWWNEGDITFTVAPPELRVSGTDHDMG